MDGYAEVWSDLPAASRFAPGPAKFERGWTWKNGKANFTRTTAIPVSVTAEEHETLKKMLGACGAVHKAVVDYVQNGWPNKFPMKEGGPARIWPTGFHAPIMDSVTTAMRAEGVAQGSTWWHARERAAAKTAGLCRAKIMTGVAPRTPFCGGVLAGLPVRMAVGGNYGATLDWRPEGWVLLPDVGWVWVATDKLAAIDRLHGLSSCHYAELGHFEQRWHIRFVFAVARDLEKDPLKERAVRKRAEKAGSAEKADPVQVLASPADLAAAERQNTLNANYRASLVKSNPKMSAEEIDQLVKDFGFHGDRR